MHLPSISREETRADVTFGSKGEKRILEQDLIHMNK